jgi:hypothetical protein
MTKRKPKIIEDKKQRGEWAELKFMAHAAEHGLPVSRPWGDSHSFDCVVGSPKKFAAVQVKSTLYEKDGGYECTIRSGSRHYRPGSFDFLAAYIIPVDVWYIIPAKVIFGRECIELYPNLKTAKYEKYREAWQLLREASDLKEEIEGGKPVAEKSDANPTVSHAGDALGRFQAAGNFFKNYLERSGVNPVKRDEEV